MQNEILSRVYSTDEAAIPRYVIKDVDGSVIHEGVEISLMNQVIQQGTPYDKNSVLPDEIASVVCPGIANPTPADALQALYVSRAPAGYGYGGAVVDTETNGDITESELDVKLKTILTSMKKGEAKQIKFVCDVLGAWTFCGTMYKSGDYYGSLVAYAEYQDKVIGVRKAYYNGVWQPFEWNYPLLVLDKEYRTTEIFDGKPVYAQLMEFGSLPAANTSKKVDKGLLGKKYLVKHHVISGATNLVIDNNVTYLFISDTETTLKHNYEDIVGMKALILCYYTKQ